MGLVILCVALLVGGGSVVVVGTQRLRRAKALGAGGGTASATVIGTKWDFAPMLFDPIGGPAARPVVRFQPEGGAEIETRAGTPPEHVRKGDTVQIRYDPLQPRRAELESWVANGGNGLLLVLGGGALAIIAVLGIALVAATM
jgi:hypothetical protein